MRWWPALGPVGVVLIELRLFVDSPSLSRESQRHPTGETVKYVHDLTPDILVGAGVTSLGLACVVVFVAALAARIRLHSPLSLAPSVMLAGVAATASAVLVGFGVLVTLAGAADEGSPSTVAAVYIISDSLGYMGWTAFGLVTGAVAVASLRDRASRRAFPGWVGWFSIVVTVAFVLCAFLPFLSWVPALMWLVVVGIGQLLHRPDADPPAARPATAAGASD